MKTRRRPIAVMLLYPLAVDGPMTALTGVIRLAGNPDFWACSRMRCSFEAL